MFTIIDLFLFLGNDYFILLFSLFGLYFIDRHVFINTLLACFFTNFFNATLKYYFAIPLNPELGIPGWSYPSGHTAFNVVFWGSLFIQMRKPWILFTGILAVAVLAFAMVEKRYHIWPDILGGACTAGLILVGFYYWMRYKAKQHLLFAILLAATSTLLYFNLPHHLVNYNWQLIVLGAYFGIVASLYLKRDLYRLTMHQALISYVVGVATCALVFYLIPYNFLKGFLLTATSVYFIPYIVSEKLKLVGKAPRPKAKAKKVKAKK